MFKKDNNNNYKYNGLNGPKFNSPLNKHIKYGYTLHKCFGISYNSYVYILQKIVHVRFSPALV